MLQVRLWDVEVGGQALRLDGHADYVRTAAPSPASSETWATGAGAVVPFHATYRLECNIRLTRVKELYYIAVLIKNLRGWQIPRLGNL